MTLQQLMRQAGTDPNKINTLSDAELIAYLTHIFPLCRPSAERIVVVEKQTKKKAMDTTLARIDQFNKLVANLNKK